jgi:hypothetical protein
MSENETSWRDYVKNFVEIGRCMETIERSLREIQATSAIDEYGSRSALYAVRAAANRISKEADMMVSRLREKPPSAVL